MMMNRKGVYCIEGEWGFMAGDATSVLPLLELLRDVEGIPFSHRDAVCATALRTLLDQWTKAKHRAYPILHVACHGKDGHLVVGIGNKSESRVCIDQFEEWLTGKCHRRIIYLGSCSLLGDLHGNRWRRFLKRTGALAVCGYGCEVPWIESSAFELFLLNELQVNALTVSGVKAMQRRIKTRANQMAKRLNFKMMVAN
jgi:hypothetical protein